MSWEQTVRDHFNRKEADLGFLVEMVEAQATTRPNPLRDNIVSILGTLKDKYEIQSVALGKTSGVLVVRFLSPEKRSEMAPALNQELSSMPDFAVESKQTNASTMPISIIRSVIDGKKLETRLVYKYELKTRQGLAFEHILAYVVNYEVTDKLKVRLDLSKKATDEEVETTLMNPPWDLHLERAFAALDKLEEHFKGKIVAAEVVGGGGTKADLQITTQSGAKVGISLKLALKKENKFIFNKDIGDGTEAGSLIPNPEPWWKTARKTVFDGLKQAGFLDDNEFYNPSDTDFIPPDWLLGAKTADRTHPARVIYNNAVSKVFTDIREQLVSSLRSMKFQDLVKLVEEAHFGTECDASERLPLYKLTSTPKGAKLEEVPMCYPNMVEIESQSVTMEDMVTSKGVRITVDIPGMPQMIIQGVKYRSSLVATKRSDLRIKTR